MKRSLMAIVATATLAAGLAACGSSGHTTSSSPGATTGSVNTTSAVSTWSRSAGAPPQAKATKAGKAGKAGKAATTAKAAKRRKQGNAPFGWYTTPTPVAGIQGTVTAISTSNSDSYALTSAGTVWAWGHGSQGELGNGSRTAKAVDAVQVKFPAGVRITKLPNPMPYDGGMAIDSTGTVWAWGNDAKHQFCQDGAKILTTPVKVPVPDVTMAAGALLHTIYDSQGRVLACGAGPNGQLGNGTSGQGADSATPVAVPGLPSGPVADLTSAWGNAGVLYADGSYYDWGFNAGGQDGDGTTTLASRPVEVHLPAPVSTVSEGGSTAANGQTMAILTDGQLWLWGNGTDGQLGDGRTGNTPTPQRLVEPGGVRFVKVNSGGATDYAIDSAGQLWAWGSDDSGQVGDGKTVKAQTTPVRIAGAFAQVSSTASDVAGLAR